MEQPILLKKGPIHIYLEYGNTHTGKLSAYDIHLRTSPRFELILDLNKNLRKRNKNSYTFIDANDLACGDIKNLKLVHLFDNYVLKRLMDTIQSMDKIPDKWNLKINLNGEHNFIIEPELKGTDSGHSLLLKVKI
jgi:hypothetical protein